MKVMEARGLRKTYEAEGAPVRALRGVDMTMEQGEFVAIMGPSGCGKSTLLNLVAGLDVPSEGEIFVAGEPSAEWTRARWQGCGGATSASCSSSSTSWRG